MGFTVSAATLASLEWSRVVDELRTACRTPQGRARIEAGESLFAKLEAEVRQRLSETSEARTLLDRDQPPPFSVCRDLSIPLGLATKGGILESAQLLDVGVTLEALNATRQFFERRQDDFPTLAATGLGLESEVALEQAIARCLDPAGEVRDSASRTLAEARRQTQKLGSELKTRIERALGQTEIAPHLSDQFYTVRSGRFVLPVKSDAKGQVRGIVHDASRSGTTLYIEPEGMVDLNNRHRQAELTVERETLRVLRDLSASVAQAAPALRANLELVGHLDWAFARADLSRKHDAVEPSVEREGIFELSGLRHPLIPPNECVANDLQLGREFSVLLLSGPNAGGKTVALKSVALAALFVRAGLHIAANPGARADLVDRVLADIGDHQDMQESLSTFSAAMAQLAETLRTAGPHCLVCLDEVGVGTDPSEGAAIAQATLEALADSGARTVTTTHYNLLKEMAELDERFKNASVEFDPETLAPTYRVRIGAPGASSASTVAARMGVSASVLERAKALLDREDRRLDQMLSELGATRAQLEIERSAAERARIEGESARDEYQTRLARLKERRDKLFGEMQSELEHSFKGAHEEVARVIRELQRGPSAQKAARIRSRLDELADETKETQESLGLVPEPAAADPSARPIKWETATVGDVVFTPGGGRGTLLSLPDRKGRVTVQASGAKLTLPQSQLTSAPGSKDDHATTPAPRLSPRLDQSVPPPALGGVAETDLRGMRVDEALDQLEAALDNAAAEGRAELRIIHGKGTGALRQAVRERLPHSVHVIDSMEAAREDGGAGATRAILRKD